MDTATIRRAVALDAHLVAALHLQLARDLGMPPEPGYLDRFAERWLSERLTRPTWIAERAGEHAGVLVTRRITPLPWPGSADLTWLHVEAIFVAPHHRRHGVGRALVEAMTLWARGTDVAWVGLDAPDLPAREFWSELGFTSPGSLMQLGLERPAQ